MAHFYLAYFTGISKTYQTNKCELKYWYLKGNVIRWLQSVSSWICGVWEHQCGGWCGLAVWSSINSLCIKCILGDYQGTGLGSVAEINATAASGTGSHRVYCGGFLDSPWLILIISSTCGAFSLWFKQLWHFSCLCPCSRTAGRLPLCPHCSLLLSPSPLHLQAGSRILFLFQCQERTARFLLFFWVGGGYSVS